MFEKFLRLSDHKKGPRNLHYFVSDASVPAGNTCHLASMPVPNGVSYLAFNIWNHVQCPFWRRREVFGPNISHSSNAERGRAVGLRHAAGRGNLTPKFSEGSPVNYICIYSNSCAIRSSNRNKKQFIELSLKSWHRDRNSQPNPFPPYNIVFYDNAF
jgi:hypothetical protein